MPRDPKTSETERVPRRSEHGGEVLAPEDYKHGDVLHAPDGRKVKDSDHVGAIAPDADPDEQPPK